MTKEKIAHKTTQKIALILLIQVPFLGVVVETELKVLLSAKKQTAWCTRVRILGLLLLVDYICRHLKKGQISMSADLAHQFVSKLRNSRSGTMITEPLLVLCKIGILEMVRSAVFAHVKTSAVYRFAIPYRKEQPLRLEVVLPPKLAQKRASADDRREKRFNRKLPSRKQLLTDLKTLTFSASARPIIAKGLFSYGRDNLSRLVKVMDLQQHFVKVNERGQITTSIGSCPKELRPHLLLDGEATVSCDIANAHWNFLPLILANRLNYVSGSPNRNTYINEGWREHNQLVALLSDGDFYRMWCVDPQDDAERNQKKIGTQYGVESKKRHLSQQSTLSAHSSRVSDHFRSCRGHQTQGPPKPEQAVAAVYGRCGSGRTGQSAAERYRCDPTRRCPNLSA